MVNISTFEKIFSIYSNVKTQPQFWLYHTQGVKEACGIEDTSNSAK